MMKQYMKNKSLFLQKEELLSRIAELFSKKILRSSGVLVFLLITCLGLFSCSKFLEENPKDKLPEDDVYNTISEVYLNAVASLYTYVGGYSDSQGLPLSPPVEVTGMTVVFGKDFTCTIGE